MLKWIRLFFIGGILACCSPREELLIVFGGDVMLDRNIRVEIESRGVDHFFSEIRPVLNNADFSFINLECPATEIHAPLTKKFIFRADPSWLPDLHATGITHCILANNHSYDHGRSGLISTHENLSTAGIVSVGYGETQHQACAPVMVEKGGIKAAVFASVPLPLESWMYLPDKPGMCQATIEDLVTSIAGFRMQDTTTFVIVTLHWGAEYRRLPSALQRDQARTLIAAGADAIIGHHPHVVQSFERIHGKPVFYSIGNLIFDNRNPITHEGLLVQLSINKRNSKIQLIPYKTQKGKPFPVTASLRDEFLLKLQNISDPLPE